MARDADPEAWLAPTRGAKTLPAVEVLTGRGFITGKSGSGKSNTASVVAEELLVKGFGLLIVDTDGEYYGLKAEYELLHAGNDDEYCDIVVGPGDAQHLAEVAIEQNVPVILDVSDFLDGGIAQELIANVVRELYHLEKDARKPFLLMIEELQEYLPQSGGSGELAELLERVAKRGRKRGLGMLGMSQRPSSVDKDFITQCDWMVWHLLTWKNDVDVVRNILGPDAAKEIERLDTGEAYLMTDWDDETARVRFKRKRTLDAGATPGLDAYHTDGEDEGHATADSSPESDSESVVDAGPADESSPATDPAPAPGEDATTAADPFRAGPQDEPVETDGAAESLDPGPAAEAGPSAEQAPTQPASPEQPSPGGTPTQQPAQATDQSLSTTSPGDLADVPIDLQDEVAIRDASQEDLVQAVRTLADQHVDLVAERDRLQERLDEERKTRISAATERSDFAAAKYTDVKRKPDLEEDAGAPRPPSKPENRDGVSGNMIEFTAMLVYLVQVLGYRCRMFLYWLRTGTTKSRGP